MIGVGVRPASFQVVDTNLHVEQRGETSGVWPVAMLYSCDVVCCAFWWRKAGDMWLSLSCLCFEAIWIYP